MDTTCFAFVSHANDRDKKNLQAMPCVGYTKINNYMDEEGRKACGEHDTHSSVPQVFQEDIKIYTNKHPKQRHLMLPTVSCCISAESWKSRIVLYCRSRQSIL